jgi:flagellar basal-body rod modification protein FlgD
MSAVDPTNILASQSSVTGATSSKDQLDQKSFLKLMIAQFKNQDPTKPKDPSEFLGQLAQFSTVSGIQEMQSSLGALADSLRSSNVLSGAVLVGRDVLTPASDIAYTGGETLNGSLEVPDGASSVDVTIKDGSGQLIRRMTVQASGSTTPFSWNGVSDNGSVAASGHYTIAATAKVGTATESSTVLLNAHVDSVTIDAASNGLILNTRTVGAVPISAVRRVM